MQAIRSILDTLENGNGNPGQSSSTNVHNQSQLGVVHNSISFGPTNLQLPNQSQYLANLRHERINNSGDLSYYNPMVSGLPSSGFSNSGSDSASNIKNQIELKDGRAQRIRQFSSQTNEIKYYRYYGLLGIWFFLLDSVANWDNLFILIFLAIHFVAQQDIELTPYFSLILLILNILIQGILNIVADLKLKAACRQVNERLVQKFVASKKKTKGFEASEWQSLRPGDIIKVREKEEFPADVLILDSIQSSNDHKCYVSGGVTDDFNVPVLKKACEGTYNRPGMKMSSRKFVEQISGTVKYEYNYNGYFTGSFKLKNNPAAFSLSLENVAVKGSQLCLTKSVICLVLNVESQAIGSPTNHLTNPRFSRSLIEQRGSFLSIFRTKRPVYDRNYYKMRIFQDFLIVLYFSISFIVFFQLKMSPSQPQHRFIKHILQLFQTDDDSNLAVELPIYIRTILAFTAALFISLPLNFKLITDLIVLMHANFAEWDYNLVPGEVKINYSASLKALGRVQNVFMSKSAVMTLNMRKAKVLQVRSHWYFDQGGIGGAQTDGGHQEIATARESKAKSQEQSQKEAGGSGPQARSSVFRNYQYPFRNNLEVQATQIHIEPLERDDTSSEEDSDHSPTTPHLAHQPSHHLNDSNEFLDPLQSYDDYLPNNVPFSHLFHNTKIRKDLSQGSRLVKESLKEIMKAIVVCHQANISSSEEVPVNKYKSVNQEEETNLMLAYSYGYQFLQKHNKSITVLLGGVVRERYDLLASHSFGQVNQQITITVTKPFKSQSYQEGATLYAKGPMSAMFHFLDQNESSAGTRHTFFEDMKRYAEMGIFPTIYVKRELQGDEAADLESRINEAMSLMKDQDEKIESSLLCYMHDMQVLGVIGTQNIFNPRDTLVIEDMIRNGIKVWMLSCEDEIQMIAHCNALKLLNSESKPLIINRESEREVEEQVKKCLNTILDKSNEENIDMKLKYTMNQTLTFNDVDQNRTNCASKRKPSKILLLSGQALHFILKDETLLKCFITITTFCDLIIGCEVKPQQKSDLMKSVKAFNTDCTNQLSTIAIITSNKDQILMNHADISIALTSKKQKLSALQIRADIVMNSIYPLSYLILKHGTLCIRRVNEVTKLLIYRSFYLALIILAYMCMHGFSASFPIKRLMLLLFMVLVSPVQIVLNGLSYCDVGFGYLHRIYGEYKRNFMVSLFSRYDLMEMLLNAILDVFIFFLISIQKEHITLPATGFQFCQDGFQVYQGIILYIIFTFQLINQNEIVYYFRFAFIFLNLIGIIFILDDEYLMGIKQFAGCPIAILYLIFVFLFGILKNYSLSVFRKLAYPSSHRRYKYYLDIEDRLFLEEYEDPDQEFDLEDFEQDYKEIEKKMAQRQIYMVNQNLTKIQRSDEIDQIIEKLNEHHFGIAVKKFQDQSILNWFSLKFNDQNKEVEYIDSRQLDKVLKFRKVIIVTLVFTILQLIKEIIFSSLHRITFESFWFFFGYTVISLATLTLTYKFQSKVQLINLAFLVFLCIFYSFSYFYIDNIEFSLFLTLVLYIFSLHGTYVHIVVFMIVVFLAMTVSLVNANFTSQIATQKLNASIEKHKEFVLPSIATLWSVYIICWSLYIYWEEKFQRLEFWQGYKKIKEFQKLKSILHILMPAFVRERIRQGQRFIADDQGEVTLLFCDIAEFDTIVQMFSGKELCEWLDNIYLSFDQLCEKNGLQKVETVGKTYMACGGLKQQEKKMDQRLLNRHHSVRVADFSMNILNFIKRQTLKDGQRVKVKIGIHSGKVISGVVGENKPQFSLIGDTVNKTSRVCSKCSNNQVLVSKETYANLKTHTSLYNFTIQTIDMKGIGRENAFYLKKGSASQITAYVDTDSSMRGSKTQTNQSTSNFGQKLQRKNTEGEKQQDFSNLAALQSGIIQKQQEKVRGKRLSKLALPLPQPEDVSPTSHNAQDQALGALQQPDTSRSLIYSDRNSVIGDPADFVNQSYDENDKGKLDESIDHSHNFLKFGDFKDDRAIFKNQVENSQYNLIERSDYLLSFNQNQYHLEENFRYQRIKENQWKKIVFFGVLCILNKFVIIFYYLENLGFTFNSSNWLTLFLSSLFGFLLLLEIVIIWRLKQSTLDSTPCTSYLLTFYFLLLSLATAAQAYHLPHNTRLLQIYLNESEILASFVFFLDILQLRQIIIIYLITLGAWIAVIATNQENALFIKTYSFALEMIYFLAILTLKNHQKEMKKRKIHNRKIIMDFEIKRTNDLLGNLVPPPVLQGIKNDQKVVDELEDVTLLFTDMVGFTQFSNNVKDPREVVKLLSELFTRFDQLCVQNKVYKVHTIGDCYVILGYTGHIPQNQRTPQIKAEEAYKVVQTGFQMIEIISDVRNRSDNPDLKDLNMRIGIHTGKIVAGIIGTKIVRYDIFGGDVLIANKMESNGLAGKVVVSEETKRLLLSLPEYSQKLNFFNHTTVELQGINRSVEAFIVAVRDDCSFGSDTSIISEGYEEEEEKEDDENNDVIDHHELIVEDADY